MADISKNIAGKLVGELVALTDPGPLPDPGSGGFNVGGQAMTMDTGVPDNVAAVPVPYVKGVDTSGALVDADGKPKDISLPTKETLAKYLSDQTTGAGTATQVPNRYPIDPSLEQSSTTRSDGTPALQTPGNAPGHNAASFASGDTNLTSLSNNFAALGASFKKGKASFTAVDGHDLLAGIPGTVTYSAMPGSTTNQGSQNPQPIAGHQDTTNVVAPYVSAVLTNNRFTATNTFGSSANSPAGFDPALGGQGILGSYDPAAQGVTSGRLATIGPLLTMRAGKELGAATAGANPNSAGMQAGAVLPGGAQIGVTRIDQQVLLASDVLAGLTTDELDAANVLSVGRLSWGQLNNTDDPFSGTNAVGMVVLSTALVASLELVFDAFSILLGMVTPSLKKPSRDAQGRYSLGEYYPGTKSAQKQASGGIGGMISAAASLNFGAMLGLQPTNYPFQQAMVAGMNAFFGIPDSKGGGIGLNQLVGAFTASTDSPGFNVVVARAIIRSSLTIVDQLKKVGGNPINAISQVLSLVDVIRSSKMLAACNVFAQLGDAALSQPDAFVDKDSNKMKVSSMDTIPDDDIASEVRKNRLQGSLKLAWASNRAPANMLMPSSLAGMSLVLKGLGQFSPYMGIGQDNHSKVQTTITSNGSAASDYGRIKIDDALAFEDKLESSYVPFYFHDLRTNEMVAFHAFLASLTDDYTANYEKSDAFGRVEQIKIYKSTERRIGMSFYIAATSPTDFDEMWVKINKLTTLVYPQYTQGIQLSSAESGPSQAYKFTQPFSQLIGASPLIRIRLGNLLRSNYSLFNLGRLFGMGNPNFTLDNAQFKGADKFDAGVLSNIAQALQQAQANPGAEVYLPLGLGNYELYDDKGGTGGIGIPAPSIPGVSGADGPKYSPMFVSAASIFQVKVKKVHPDNPLMVIGEVQFNNDYDFVQKYKDHMSKWNRLYNNDDLPLQRVVGGQYVFPFYMLQPVNKTMSTIIGKMQVLAGLENDPMNKKFATNLHDFLSPANNAVVKSFKDTSGKGLAGFIETMNFDWYDKVTWETEPGRCAPKICKVTMTFSPVHDISPGIDHLGMNRAPLYRVGMQR